jgi:Golgi SNAP receptor complex protein 1
MADYESLHRQCRTLESLFDTKLTSYSRLASTITRNQDDIEAGGSRERWKDVEGEVEDLLEKVGHTGAPARISVAYMDICLATRNQ